MQKEVRRKPGLKADLTGTRGLHSSQLYNFQTAGRSKLPAAFQFKKQGIAALHLGESNESGAFNGNIGILAALEAENAELRNQAVDLALEIQELSYPAKG